LRRDDMSRNRIHGTVLSRLLHNRRLLGRRAGYRSVEDVPVNAATVVDRYLIHEVLSRTRMR